MSCRHRSGDPLTKVCSKCGQEKHLMEFYLDYGRGRRQAQCKACARAYSRRYHRANAARRRARHRHWYAANAERCREQHRQWYAANAERCRRRSRQRYAAHRERELASRREWARWHRERVREQQRRYRRRYPRRLVVRQVSRGLWKLGLLDVGERCEDCGSREIELHHPDYADPFRVVALCHACHMARHFAEWRRTGGGPVKYPDEYWEVGGQEEECRTPNAQEAAGPRDGVCYGLRWLDTALTSRGASETGKARSESSPSGESPVAARSPVYGLKAGVQTARGAGRSFDIRHSAFGVRYSHSAWRAGASDRSAGSQSGVEPPQSIEDAACPVPLCSPVVPRPSSLSAAGEAAAGAGRWQSCLLASLALSSGLGRRQPMRRIVLLAWLAAATAALAAGRLELSLSGQWEHRKVADLAQPPTGGAWKPCTVPGYLRGTSYERAWFRRSFTVPAAMRGQRLELRFGGVKYHSRVVVNGKRVGGCFGGYQPFEVDVTDAVRVGGPNELLVGVHDWTGLFTPGRIDLGPTEEWTRMRRRPDDKILAPIGGLYSLYGIWDDVTLVAHPAVYVQDLFIKPSVRRKELTVEYRLANESPADAQVDIAAAVEEGRRSFSDLRKSENRPPPRDADARVVLRLPVVRVRVPAGGTATVSAKAGWPKPRLWSHVDPHLYHLRTELSSGDALTTRFGFREFWVEGHRFVLNGVPVNLLATSWWPPHAPMTREQVEERWRAIKAAGCVAFRTHTQPWRPVHYDVADELGLLMIIEGAIWNDDSVYRVKDPVFWDNYAKHLEAMVARDKNRASVVMWSLENEMTGSRMNDRTPYAKGQLVRMGRLVKQWDPTRPIFYESDGDPDGVADAIGIHYPHEYPGYTCWPNEAYWLDKPSRGHGGGGFFLNGAPHFLWQKDKPLYVGEFLWLPSSDPSWHTVFFGDTAYTDYRRYRRLGKAACWRMQILGYRSFEVGGISPWTVIEGGPLDETNPCYRAHQYAYQPIAAYCHDYDRRFYAGEEVKRRLEVFNDTLEAATLDVGWTLSRDGRELDKGAERLHLTPTEHKILEAFPRMPAVRERTPVAWRVTVERDGKTVFDETHRYAVFPRLRLPAVSARLGLYDPRGATRALLAARGVRAEAVASLDRVPAGLDVLAVGADAFDAGEQQAPVIGRVAPERAALAAFVARGGRVLVLEQRAYPEGLFQTALTRQASTMTFPLQAGHPALKGVEPGDLKFWRGDHMVSEHEPARPASGASIPIVVSGSASGIDNAPLLERPVGKGCIVHCQLKLLEKFAAEPTAARILVNLLDYLARYTPTARKTALVGGDPVYRAYLRSLGLRFDDPKASLAGYSLVICRGRVEQEARLRQFVERGGNLLVHRVPAKGLEGLRKALGIDATLHPCSGPVTRAEGGDPLLEAVAREDLYWLGKHTGIGWSTTPRATGMADSVFAKTLDGKQATAHEIENWAREGHIVHLRDQAPQGVVFATVGSASAELDFPATSTYIVGIRAMGTPCQGIYPQARITIDGKLLGTVSVADEQWRTYTAFGEVEKGTRKVAVAFINDGSDPPREDRNLHVDKVLVARDDSPVGVKFLTTPPAVAYQRVGKGLVVIDQLRWDTEERNARKAARYACGLLTALGGDFAARDGVAVECETMEPQPGMLHFHVRGTHAALACNGWIATSIEVAAAGRYTAELVASGSAVEGVYPHVNLLIDGKRAGDVQLTSGAWRPYPVAVELPEGKHQLKLEFDNDQSIPGVADRNVMIDKVVFYRE